MNTNGVLSFRSSFANLPLISFPLVDPLEFDSIFIAPYLGDVDTRGAGEIYYRGSTDSGVIDSVQENVGRFFSEESRGFVPSYAFVATWDRVGSFSNNTAEVNMHVGYNSAF